jgi:predicted nicotinamide N-methyase
VNAEANCVAVTVVAGDVTAGDPPAVDVLTVGDLFYERPLARRVTAFLDRCAAAGIAVLVGDPNRRYLPLNRLVKLAEYVVPDVGEVEATATNPSAVFAWTTAS